MGVEVHLLGDKHISGAVVGKQGTTNKFLRNPLSPSSRWKTTTDRRLALIHRETVTRLKIIDTQSRHLVRIGLGFLGFSVATPRLGNLACGAHREGTRFLSLVHRIQAWFAIWARVDERRGLILGFMIKRLDHSKAEMSQTLMVKEKSLLRSGDVDILWIVDVLRHVGLVAPAGVIRLV